MTFNDLKLYETNTSNQSEPELTFSLNRLQLSADGGCKDHRQSTGREANRFSQIEQRFSLERNGPRFCRGIFSVHCDRLDLSLADLLEHCRRSADGARLLKRSRNHNQESRKPGNNTGKRKQRAPVLCHVERQRDVASS